MKYRIGILGVGMVGGALKRYFEKKPNYKLYLYDKKGIGSFEELNKADFIYVCLPTPSNPDGSCNTDIVEGAIKEIKGNKVIIIKSTVPVGTTDKLQTEHLQHKFLFNPEFLTELTADQDMCYPDRQIVGYTKKSFTIAKDIIQQLPLAPFERIVPAKEAEMCKYVGNSWFSTKVIFANQIYDLCEKLEIDYNTIRDLASADKRIGRTHLEIWHKGYRGFGGKCLPKDTKAIISFAEKNGINMELLRLVDKINETLICQKS